MLLSHSDKLQMSPVCWTEVSILEEIQDILGASSVLILQTCSEAGFCRDASSSERIAGVCLKLVGILFLIISVVTVVLLF